MFLPMHCTTGLTNGFRLYWNILPAYPGRKLHLPLRPARTVRVRDVKYGISVESVTEKVYRVTGDTCRDDRAALQLLCMFFQKKNAQDSVLYIYEEYIR